MPIYEYRCNECQQVFEEWNKHIEDESVPHTCPICKGAAHRLISNTSFALKGGGWYVTEYGSRKTDSASTASSTPSAAAPPAADSSSSAATTAEAKKSAVAAPAS